MASEGIVVGGISVLFFRNASRKVEGTWEVGACRVTNVVNDDWSNGQVVGL